MNTELFTFHFLLRSVSMILKAIPAQLNKNASRYQVSGVTKHGRADRLAETLSK